jgi:hypothetical protein
MSKWKETLERIGLALGISMLLGVLLLPDFRPGVAGIVGALLGPLPEMLPIFRRNIGKRNSQRTNRN